MNPNAIVFWAICACVGWLIGDATGLVVGLTASMTVSFVISNSDVFGRRRSRR